MARRERTTALPRPRPRDPRARSRRSFFLNREDTLRLAILGGASALLVIVLGLLGWVWYHQTFRIPEKTVLQVGEERFPLKYYADRLFPFTQAVAGTGMNLTMAQQQLLAQLEFEAIVNAIARERGITVTTEEITNEIASQLGVPAGGAGTTFDAMYRQHLQTLAMTHDHHHRWIESQVYYQKLSDAFLAEIGDTTEMVTLRTIITTTEEEARAALARIQAGEDMGTVAQTTSKDLNSRQRDGILDPEPPALLPAAIQAAIEGREAGPELLGPVQVAGRDWWLFRLERRDPAATPSEAQKSQLAELRIDQAVEEKRATITIRRTITSEDFRWAEEHAN